MTNKLIAAELPYLRRYARALSGSQQAGDLLVRHMLESLVATPDLLDPSDVTRVGLYMLFHNLNHGSAVSRVADDGPVGTIEAAVQSRLDSIPATGRQLLLLTVLEGFTLEEAARIVSLRTDHADTLLAETLGEIEQQSLSSVMIIEDEPMIAMELESVVTGLGHSVVGNATTHAEAVEMFAEMQPKLVLADIQLADGSSGISAVKEILDSCDTPIIFITAYPERLLTGDRPEPTYLITKPFTVQAVKVAISQALFLKTTARPLINA
jgi:CheY-like chemotaxis protein